MIEQIARSHDNVLGFRVSGDVTRDDYDILDPAVRAAVDASGSAHLLLDLTDFHWERAEAWGRDLRFGKELGSSLQRMAIVGNRSWEKLLARLAAPFYAQDARYFDDPEEAWAWLESAGGD
jgi:SpoIIAA-like